MTFSGKSINKTLAQSLLIISLGCLHLFSFAQNPVSSTSTNQNTGQGQENSDTSTYVAPKRNTFKLLFSGKPGKAALYSLIFPSGGQIYNKKWLKVPLALGVDGYFLYNLINKQKIYNDYNDIVNIYNNGGTYPDISEQAALNFRAAARTNREYAWVYFIVGHLVTVFDAYVDRHLMDFDISPDLTLVGGPSAGISLTIPLNQKKKHPPLPVFSTP